MGVRAVTLDFGGTLVEGRLDKAVFVSRFRKLLSELGVEASGRDVRRAVSKALERRRALMEELREIRFEEFYSIVLRELGAPVDEEVLERVFETYSNSFRWTVIPGAVEAVLELRRGYRLAVVSNTTSRMPLVIIREMGLSDVFDAVVLSRDVGWRKPHPRIFGEALKALRVEAWEAVHVGDSPESDVTGAKAVGMRAILVGGAAEPLDPPPDILVKNISDVPKALEKLQDPQAM